MKTLLILRHGKTEQENQGGDRMRELVERGRNDAAAIGRELRQRDSVPNLIVSSDAVRARQTAEIVAESSGYEGDLAIEPRIYNGGVEGVIAALRVLPDNAASVMIVGHNPTLEILAGDLIEPGTTQTQEITLPTCGLVALEFDIEKWSGVRGSLGTLLWTVTPKSLKLS